MKYNEVENKIELDKQTTGIIDLAIVELGGPLHSVFAKHLQHYHFPDFDRIRKELNEKNSVALADVHLLIDLLQVFLDESLETDWGTTYEGVQKKDVEKVLADLIQVFSEHVKKY